MTVGVEAGDVGYPRADRRERMMATQGATATGAATVEGARAEIDAVIETAGKVAHEGLDPNADSVRVLAGLVLQLAEQVGRLVDRAATSSATTDRSPNEADAPIEEDVSPGEAPARPARPV